MVEIEYSQKDVARFWSKVRLPEIIGMDECWEWQANKNKDGYGLFYANYKSIFAHRFAYTITVEKIPLGLCVCHRCDNSACVNPDHLWLGSHVDNMDDMVLKGRSASKCGVNNPRHRLNNEDIKQIRALYKTGSCTQQQIGNLFNISQREISYIVNHKAWKNIS